jgi:hypothetical protein
MRHVKILKPPIGGQTRWGGHHQQVLWHTMREVAFSEYYSEGPKAAIWLMDFEYPHLTRVAKCELNQLHQMITHSEGQDTDGGEHL